MGYHIVNPDELDQWDDRPADVRSLSVAAGYDFQESKLGMRIYTLEPGQQAPLHYHYHDEQLEAFFVLEGTLHVETPDGEYVVETERAMFIDPKSPQRAYNPEDADGQVRLLAVGAPTVDDGQAYDPEKDEDEGA